MKNGHQICELCDKEVPMDDLDTNCCGDVVVCLRCQHELEAIVAKETPEDTLDCPYCGDGPCNLDCIE